MKNWVRVVSLLSFVLFIFSGCGNQKQQVKQKEQVDWPFYEIRSDNQTVGYLLGTIHFGKKEMYPFPDEIIEAIHSSSEVVSEVTFASFDSPTTAALSQKAMAKKPHIMTDLTVDEKERLSQKLASYNFKLEDVKDLNYFGLLSMLQGQYVTTNDFLQGVNINVGNEVSKSKIKNTGFETVAEQYQLMNEATMDVTKKSSWIEDIPELSDAITENEKLLTMYISGELEENFDTVFQANQYEGFKEIILEKRNLNWLQKLKEKLPNQKQTFIIVGAGHLYGKTGLIALLENEEYTVNKIE
ncbi:hypothetical protein ATZ33_02230 [Enterococcus silesiacus]|uniref:Polysaccharide biosynthesis protein GumN n=1 Tax=Enterococcus silesiacus TaxID=332949 RepID=A0A0S3K7H7_9ENTE|nr:TraB/GumN family protein [Enterococcus silesiacus]ALS00234.1 hypothetical protein ATZ33_02230 [Enterococcus silesiacus]OJG93214.1 hypothetical protein RV15_GL001246 [Enterococcus silesiacus]